MKYMCVFKVPTGNIIAAAKRIKEADPKPGSGARILGWWDEVCTGKGYTLIEADDHAAAAAYFAQWADLMEQKVVPVIDKKEFLAVPSSPK